MQMVYVISQHVSYEWEGTRSAVIAARFGSLQEVQAEVDHLNQAVDTANLAIGDKYYYTFEAIPTTGYSAALDLNSKDADVQRHVFKNGLRYAFERVKRDYVTSGVERNNVTLRQFFFFDYTNEVLSREEAELIYDEYVKEMGDDLLIIS